MAARRLLGFFAALTAFCCASALAAEGGFAEMPSRLEPRLCGAKNAALALDGDVETHCEFEKLTIECETAIGGLMMEWDEPPERFAIDGQARKAPLLREYIQLETPRKKVELTAKNGWLAELCAFPAGQKAEEAQNWKPSADKADLLVIAAHPDDDMLYFGGVIPYYAGERGLSVQTVYMTSGARVRKSEALNALWLCKNENFPVFLDFKDRFCTSEAAAAKLWGGEEYVTETLAGLIRRFRPEVIVTHDLRGEYGHGAHMLTAKCALEAVSAAADKQKYTKSAKEYGAWQAKKLYLHLFPQNRIVMDWRKRLTAFGGKTALEMAREGWAMHVSQASGPFEVTDSGKTSCAAFGLAASTVGIDKSRNDMFENI